MLHCGCVCYTRVEPFSNKLGWTVAQMVLLTNGAGFIILDFRVANWVVGFRFGYLAAEVLLGGSIF